MTVPLDQILHGDCVSLMQSLPEKSVDLIFADPPYNLQLQNALWRPNQTLVDGVDDAWDQVGDFAAYDAFSRAWLTECRRLLKDDGTIWVIGSYHNIYRLGSVLLDLGFWILNDVLWYKTNPMPNFRGTRFTNATETLIWAKKSAEQKQYTFNYHAMKQLNEEKQMPNVWHLPICIGEERLKIDGKKAHSTQKPEALLYRVILSSSNVGDVVLDPFFGSGTTGAVAKKLKRHYIGLERETRYIALAEQRLANIPPPTMADELLITPSKRSLPRVKFGWLIEGGYLTIGQTLWNGKRQAAATVKADGQLVCQADGFTGSIHKAAAHQQGKPNANGWEFWYYEDSAGELVSIDALRDQYRADHNLS